MNKLISVIALSILIAGVSAGFEVVSESFQGNEFSDAQGWVVGQEANVGQSIITVCDKIKMFGGYNKFGKQAIASKNFVLPAHHTLKIKVQLWKIDTWDNEEFHVWVDDQVVWRRRFKITEGDSSRCGIGGNAKEMIMNLDIDVKHSDPGAVILFTSSLNEAASNESWAIRDFQLLVALCPEKCSTCKAGDSEETCKYWELTHSYWMGLDSVKIGPEGWTMTGGSGASNCGSVALLGGFMKTGKGTILKNNVELPPHYRIKTKMMLAKIGCWNNWTSWLYLDGQVIFQKAINYSLGYAGLVCGSDKWAHCLTLFTRIDIEAAHTGRKALYEFKTNLAHDHINESFGLRDFQIYLARCAKNCQECTGPKSVDCQKCANNWVLQDGECKPLANFILLSQAFMEDSFTGIDGWTLVNNKGGQKISSCSGLSMVGGYNIFGRAAAAKKTFKIPDHTRLRMIFTVFKIDSWDLEWFYAKVDGINVWKAQWAVQTGNGNFCGGVWPDAKFRVDEIFNHKDPEAEIYLTSTINEDASTESWGFREFQLYYEPKEECAILFTECDYKGASFEFCSKSPNFTNDNIPSKIRSIRIPPQGKVTLYENTDFKGKKVVFTEDQPCIKNLDFSFIQTEGNTSEKWIRLEGQ